MFNFAHERQRYGLVFLLIMTNLEINAVHLKLWKIILTFSEYRPIQ